MLLRFLFFFRFVFLLSVFVVFFLKMLGHVLKVFGELGISSVCFPWLERSVGSGVFLWDLFLNV